MTSTPGGPILFKDYEEGWIVANQEGWHLHEVPAFGKLKEEDLKFDSTLGYRDSATPHT